MTLHATGEIWTRFLTRYYLSDILSLANEYPDKRSLYIDFINIEKFKPELADELLNNPIEAIELLEDTLKTFDLPIHRTLGNAHVRLRHVLNLLPIRSIRSEHIGKLVAIDGLVRVVADVRPDLSIGVFECSGCGELINLPQSPGLGRFTEPYFCVNDGCGRRGPFKLLSDKSEFIDAHRIRVQESPEDLRGGEQPQTLDIAFEDDIAGIVSPGDHVTVVGILRSYQRILRTGKSTTFDIILNANSIELHDKEFTEVEITPEEEKEIIKLSKDPDIYSMIIQSIAPSIYGYEEVKEGLALQIMSGVSKNLPDGTRIRGDVHILLVGDPGIAKSQLLRYVTKLAPRGIYTSGRSSSAVGLTASAVKNDLSGGDGRWTLEAGALVLADHGIVAIDELDKMRPEDRSALHESAEQQTVTVTKAGIQTTLKSRCAILAAANPKHGRFDPYESISSQIAVTPALLSRFDLIYIMKDEPNAAIDGKIADHILDAHYAGGLNAQRTRSPTSNPTEAQITDAMKIVMPIIPPNLLRLYMAYAKKNIFPIVPADVRSRLRDFYLSLRKQGEDRDAPVPATARQLEALERLCEASARLRLSETATIEDADRTIRVTESCLRNVAYDKETGMFDTDIIASGVSKSQRDKFKLLMEIIKEITDDQPGGAPEEMILEVAKAQGFDEEHVLDILHRLMTQGQLYSPKKGAYRVTT